MPKRRSSQNSYSTHFVNKGMKQKGRGCYEPRPERCLELAPMGVVKLIPAAYSRVIAVVWVGIPATEPPAYAFAIARCILSPSRTSRHH